MKQPAQIRIFLAEMKKIVKEKSFILVHREASNDFIRERNILFEELEELVLGLEVSDCFDGPEPDRDPRYSGWTVAEFSPMFNGEKLYLKLSIKLDPGACKCLSVKLFIE